jgi:glycine cleavage system aminomethyltransferase T
MQAGESAGISVFGRSTSHLRRIEKGQVLEGDDYIGATYARSRADALTPFELGWGSKVDLGRDLFNGRAALRRMAGTPTRWTYLNVEFEASDICGFKTLFAGNKFAGMLTSNVYSPLFLKRLGIAKVLLSEFKSLKSLALAKGQNGTERIPVRIRPTTESTPRAV